MYVEVSASQERKKKKKKKKNKKKNISPPIFLYFETNGWPFAHVNCQRQLMPDELALFFLTGLVITCHGQLKTKIYHCQRVAHIHH